MKVIFLDNDGVICLSNNWDGRSKKMARMKKILGGGPAGGPMIPWSGETSFGIWAAGIAWGHIRGT